MRILAAVFIGYTCLAASPPAGAPPSIMDRTLDSEISESTPRWLRLSGELRFRGEGRTGINYASGNDDAYGLVRTRLNVEILPTESIRFFFQGQDARAPGLREGRPQAIFRDPFDVRQAYVQFAAAQGKIKLTVGRQLLLYGAQRLIGPLDWTNTSRNWDAVRLELGTADSKVDVFASSVVAIDPTRRIDQPVRGSNLHGIYGSFKKAVPKSVFEPYVLWKTARLAAPYAGGDNRSSTYSAGVRLAAAPATPGLHGFDYQTEWIRQWGRAGGAGRSAWAAYGIVGYTLPDMPLPLRLSAEYSYASGQDDPASRTVGTFDHLYGTNHLFYGLVDNVGWQNIHNPRVGFDTRINKRLQIAVDYHWFWLASANDALYDVAGRVTVRGRPGSSRNVGRELDLQTNWSLGRQWKLGGGIGRFFAGPFLKQNSGGASGWFPYIFTQYAF